VGAIAGVFFAIHVGMPELGLKGLITAGAGLDIALGVGLFWWVFAREAGGSRPVAVTVLGIGAIAATVLFVELDPYKMAPGSTAPGTCWSDGSTGSSTTGTGRPPR